MARERGISNPLALVVLAFLVQEPMHPYQIGRLLKERSLEDTVKYRPSSLYMVVEQLARDGYIEAQQASREGRRPERTTYALTSLGRTALRERMADLVAQPTNDYPAFGSALALLVVLPPRDVPDLLRQREQTLAERIGALRSRIAAAEAEGVERLFMLEYEYRLTLHEAELAFVRRVADLLDADPDALGEFWESLHRAGGRKSRRDE